MTGDDRGDQERYLELVRSGVKLKEARATIGVTQKQVWDWMHASEEFKRLNAEAKAFALQDWG